MFSIVRQICLVLVVSTYLTSCASTQTVSQPTKRFFWPQEPDEPRIEWITAYYGDSDIKEKGALSAIIGSDSSVEFGRPISVASDGEGRFIVTDAEQAQVYMFNLLSHEVAPIGGDASATSFTQPTGVAVDGSGVFYAADTKTRKIFVVSKENKIISVLDISKLAASIAYITVDRVRSNLIVADPKGVKVLILSLTGELRSTINGKGYFTYPNAVAVGSDGGIYIADSFNATILRFSAEGKYLSAIGKRGDSPGNFTLVTGVAVDSEDHIYATDGRLHNVTIFDKQGNTLMVVGAQHSVRSGNIGRGGFQIPQAISIDKNDRIYVSDSFNRRVQVFQYLNSRYLSEHPIMSTKP